MTRPVLALSALALAALSACGTAADAEVAAVASTSPPAVDGTELVIGSVSDDPEEEAEVFQPFVDHVAAALEDQGVGGGRVVIAETPEEMAQLLRDGEVDLYIDNMYGVTTVVRDGAGEALLRRWKDGAPTYHSIVVTRRDSGIASLDDLRGRVVAFEEETSTDGFFLPSTSLREQGLDLTAVAEPGATVGEDEVGYVFSGDDENTVFLVLDGSVDAGALSEEDLAENAGSRVGELITIATTVDVPRHGVVFRTGLDAELLRALTGLLTTLHETDEGAGVLEEFDETARFDVLRAADLEPVLRLREVLDAPAP